MPWKRFEKCMLPLKSLVDVSGKEAFRKLLGAKVYSLNGEYIGYLKRIYVEKKRGKATKIVVRLLNGGLLVLDPSIAVIGPDGRITLKTDVKVEAKVIGRELDKLQTMVSELRSVRERLLELDEAFISGELTKATYQRFRAALEQRRQKIVSEIKRLVEELEPYTHRLEEERKKLLSQMSSAEGEKSTQILKKLRELRELLARVNELIDNAVHELSFEMELEEFIDRYLRD
ncbi:MAG: PRC-barrel domain-containing protein [Thermofilaceae archaeon]